MQVSQHSSASLKHAQPLPSSTFDEGDFEDDVDDLQIQPMISINKDIARRPSVLAQSFSPSQLTVLQLLSYQ